MSAEADGWLAENAHQLRAPVTFALIPPDRASIAVNWPVVKARAEFLQHVPAGTPMDVGDSIALAMWLVRLSLVGDAPLEQDGQPGESANG